MKTYEVKLLIRAECVDDAKELLDDYTGTETTIKVKSVKETDEDC